MAHGVRGKKSRIAAILYTLLMGLVMMVSSGASGRSATPDGQILSKKMLITGDESSKLILADRQERSQPEDASGTGEEKSVEDPSDNASKKTTDRPKSKKSLKPFQPTERISADQAVDFPSDI
jgi:hypothetical protein